MNWLNCSHMVTGNVLPYYFFLNLHRFSTHFTVNYFPRKISPNFVLSPTIFSLFTHIGSFFHQSFATLLYPLLVVCHFHAWNTPPHSSSLSTKTLLSFWLFGSIRLENHGSIQCDFSQPIIYCTNNHQPMMVNWWTKNLPVDPHFTQKIEKRWFLLWKIKFPWKISSKSMEIICNSILLDK